MYSTLTSPLQNPLLFNFSLHPRAKPKPKTIPFERNPSFFVKSFSPLFLLRVTAGAAARCSGVDDEVNNNRPIILSNNLKRCNGENNGIAVAKPIAYALLCVVFGILCPSLGFQKPALAAVAASRPAVASESVLSKENEEKGHKYSGYTRRLLEVVSRPVKIIEEAKKPGQDDVATDVEEGLKEVKMTKEALQEEIMNGLYAELRVLKGQKRS